MSDPQIIHGPDGAPAFAVIPWKDYVRMKTGLSDEQVFDAAKADGAEAFPMEVADRILAGDNPVVVFRSYRGLTQRALAAAVAVTPMYISQIETGKRHAGRTLLLRLAAALGVTVDDLIQDDG